MSEIGDGNVVITQALFDKMVRSDMHKAADFEDTTAIVDSAELRKLLSGAPAWTAADAAILAARRKGYSAFDFFNKR